MRAYLQIFLSLALMITENSASWTITTVEFERINYCNYENSDSIVLAACRTINASFGGGCSNAYTVLKDTGGLEVDIWSTIGLCWTQEAYYNCVTNDTESASDLLVWTYNSSTQRCTPVRVEKGGGTKKLSKSDDSKSGGGSDGNYAFGIPVGGTDSKGKSSSSGKSGRNWGFGVFSRSR